MDTLSETHFYYALRLTPYPNQEEKVLYCRERIPEFIKAISGEDYIFGQEYEDNYHFHIVFSTTEELHPDKKKDKRMTEIKECLYTTFDVPKDKRGNPTYSMEVVRSNEKAFSYAVKDGDYECSEAWREVATEAYENSHTKKHSLKSSLAKLFDKYMKDEIDDKDLWIGLGQSRAELGLPLSLRWIDEMCLSIQCKKDPNKLKELWEDIETKRVLKELKSC